MFCLNPGNEVNILGHGQVLDRLVEYYKAWCVNKPGGRRQHASGVEFRDAPAHRFNVEFWDIAQRSNTLTSSRSTRRRNCILHIALRTVMLDQRQAEWSVINWTGWRSIRLADLSPGSIVAVSE
jgi:hypothetical protein